VEELFALFSESELAGSPDTEAFTDAQETVCSISLMALNGTTSDHSGVIQLHARIVNHEVLILIDSGSSASFINQQLAEQLPGKEHLPFPCRVRVTDGSQYRCTSLFRTVNGFHSDTSFRRTANFCHSEHLTLFWVLIG
jgi:hypothetical protein